MAQKKKKPELVLVGTLVPIPVANALKALGLEENRSVSRLVRILIEDSPQVRAALNGGPPKLVSLK